MADKVIQDYYPEDVACCYGCGYLNDHGYRIKSRWEGDEAVCRFQPEPYHTSVRGFAYGGLMASLIDCHSIGTAAAAWMGKNGMELGEVPTVRFVTGSLKVDFLAPTPIEAELEIRSRAVEIGDRKVIVESELSAGGLVTAKGRTVAVRMRTE